MDPTQQDTIRVPQGQQDGNDVLADYSPEELQVLKSMLDQRLGAQQDAPKFQYTLPDGRQIQGTQEEIQGQLNQYFQSAQRPEAQPQADQNPTASQPPAWSDTEFERARTEGGVQGALDYYMKVKFGGQDPAHLLGLYGQALNTVGNQVLDFGRERFLRSHEGSEVETYDAAVKFCQENGWPAVGQNLDRAYVLLQHEGRIPKAEAQSSKGQTPTNYSTNPNTGFNNNPSPHANVLPDATQQTFVPEQLSNSSEGAPGWTEVPNDVNAITQATDHMTTDQLRTYIDQTLSNQGGRVQ